MRIVRSFKTQQIPAVITVQMSVLSGAGCKVIFGEVLRFRQCRAASGLSAVVLRGVGGAAWARIAFLEAAPGAPHTLLDLFFGSLRPAHCATACGAFILLISLSPFPVLERAERCCSGPDTFSVGTVSGGFKQAVCVSLPVASKSEFVNLSAVLPYADSKKDETEPVIPPML